MFLKVFLVCRYRVLCTMHVKVEGKIKLQPRKRGNFGNFSNCPHVCGAFSRLLGFMKTFLSFWTRKIAENFTFCFENPLNWPLSQCLLDAKEFHSSSLLRRLCKRIHLEFFLQFIVKIQIRNKKPPKNSKQKFYKIIFFIFVSCHIYVNFHD